MKVVSAVTGVAAGEGLVKDVSDVGDVVRLATR